MVAQVNCNPTELSQGLQKYLAEEPLAELHLSLVKVWKLILLKAISNTKQCYNTWGLWWMWSSHQLAWFPWNTHSAVLLLVTDTSLKCWHIPFPSVLIFSLLTSRGQCGSGVQVLEVPLLQCLSTRSSAEGLICRSDSYMLITENHPCSNSVLSEADSASASNPPLFPLTMFLPREVGSH